METNVVYEVNKQRYETARTKGTFKTRRQTKQIYIQSKTCNGSFKILLWFCIVREIVLCVCVCLTQLKLQKGLNNKSVLFVLTMHF